MSIVQHLIAETKTEYDRKHRQWLSYPAGLELEQAFLADAVEIFPAGKEGWRAATLSALTRDVPEVAAWVDALIQGHPNNPPFIDRLLKGALLVRDGHVLALEVGRGGNPDFIFARVRSSQGEREYHVYHSLAWACECGDWDNGRAYIAGYPRATWAPHVAGQGVMCKHVLAVYLANQVQAESQAHEKPARMSDAEYLEPLEQIYNGGMTADEARDILDLIDYGN